jgi:hypothetical protein
VRRLLRLAMRGAGRGGNATIDGGVKTGSACLGRIVERGVRAGWQNNAPSGCGRLP